MELIEALYQEHAELRHYLVEQGQVTFLAELERTYPKVLLIAVASFFEVELIRILDEYFAKESDGDELTLAFIREKAFKRQYHTYFSWDAANVNAFWALFGADFKAYAVARVKADAPLTEAAARFVEVGRLRNQLMHENFVAWPLDVTALEVVELARSAYSFLETLPSLLDDYEPAVE